ncbi:MAG: OmpA family protein [candidate division Zixibacteria bacterium]|nr:OmpA family protein [candidate division Zixibacteria bacterium]
MFKSQVLGVAGALILLLALNVSALADVTDDLTYQGNKARITVGKIKPKASKCSGDMAAAIGEMLSTSLTNTGNFIVLASQEEVAELAEEIDFAQSGYVEDGKGPEKGLMEGADLLITGSVTAFEPDAGGKGGVLGGFKKKALGGIGASSKEAKIIMDIKLIDIRTRRILKAKEIEAKSKKWKVGMAGGSSVGDVVLGGALGMYSNEPMEKAIRTSLAKTIEMVSKEVPKEYYRYQGGGQYTQEYGGGQQGGAAEQTGGTATSQASATTGASSTPASTGPVAEDMKLYAKYDFVPGNKVIYFDDLAGEEDGEFPYRWNLEKGVFEIVRYGGDFWIMCSNNGSIRPKMPDAPLPQMYTVEIDFYSFGAKLASQKYAIYWVNAKGKTIGEFSVHGYGATYLGLNGKRMADKTVPDGFPKGVNAMRIMATSRSMKCYINSEKVANVPKVDGFNPVGFLVRLVGSVYPDRPSLVRNFRFAEGGQSMRKQLDETGKIVTHGILFDPDAYKIKGESFKTLKDIGNLLQEDPNLRLSIEGHTDSDGSDDHNMTLSRNRAASVSTYLSSKYGISADRLESKGWGETKPIDTNDSTEGKANNRRVELVKL